MAEEKFKLIPMEWITWDLIEQYNWFWKHDNSDAIDWIVKLFKNEEPVSIIDYIKEEDFKQYQETDDIIRSGIEHWKLKNGQDELFEILKQINITYHTRVSDIKKIADDSDIQRLLIGDGELDSFDLFVEQCKEATGSPKHYYSFATKVFSFFFADKTINKTYNNRRGYPILDSFVVTLLKYYLPKKLQQKWGKYENYINAYNAFVDQLLTNSKKDKNEFIVEYKKIDVFLWTYGNALANYWRKEGVINFSSVQYDVSK